MEEDIASCTCPFFHGYGLPCRHILFVSTEENLPLPVERYNSRWRTVSIGMDVMDPDVPDQIDASSPIAIRRARTQRRAVTREKLWCEANVRARNIANALSDMPFPAFQRYLQSLQLFEDAIKQNRMFRVIMGTFWCL